MKTANSVFMDARMRVVTADDYDANYFTDGGAGDVLAFLDRAQAHLGIRGVDDKSATEKLIESEAELAG